MILAEPYVFLYFISRLRFMFDPSLGFFQHIKRMICIFIFHLPLTFYFFLSFIFYFWFTLAFASTYKSNRMICIFIFYLRLTLYICAIVHFLYFIHLYVSFNISVERYVFLKLILLLRFLQHINQRYVLLYLSHLFFIFE